MITIISEDIREKYLSVKLPFIRIVELEMMNGTLLSLTPQLPTLKMSQLLTHYLNSSAMKTLMKMKSLRRRSLKVLEKMMMKWR